MAHLVGVYFAESAIHDASTSVSLELATKTRPDGSKVAIHPDGTELIGCDVETSLIWVGGLHNEFSGSVSACISRLIFLDGSNEFPTTDPWSSITGGWWAGVRRVRMTLDCVSGYGASRLRMGLWA